MNRGLTLKLCQVSCNMPYAACANLHFQFTIAQLPLWYRSLSEITESGLDSQRTPPTPAALPFQLFHGKGHFLGQCRGNNHYQGVNSPHCSLPAS